MNNPNHQATLPPFGPGHRSSGVLMHVTSLPSPYGIGDLGPAAFAWVDRLKDAGQSWWQALPLGPTGCGNSPYSCLSSFAGNSLLVSPDLLIEDGLLSRSDCDAGRRLPKSAVDFDAVVAFKHRLLEQAWRNFDRSGPSRLWEDFERFCSEEAHWLDDYALFRALKARFRGAHLLDWPEELLKRDASAMASARRELADEIYESRFGQFLVSRQGSRLKEYAHQRRVLLIGDLPFFVSLDSSDVWANRECFQLDANLRPRFVAGVPPDYFSAQGQLWGNPVYDWEALRHVGYRWCIDRLKSLLAHIDLVRLDHFRAFCAAGTFHPRPKPLNRAIGFPAPALTSLRPCGRSWAIYRSWQRISALSLPTWWRFEIDLSCRESESSNSVSMAIRLIRISLTITSLTQSPTLAPMTIPPRGRGLNLCRKMFARSPGGTREKPAAGLARLPGISFAQSGHPVRVWSSLRCRIS